jgi:hypothetical protein
VDKAKEKELKEKLINHILKDDDDVNIMVDEFVEKKDIEDI